MQCRICYIAKIKGTHTAMKSGMLAAESVFTELSKTNENKDPVDLSSYDQSLRASWVYKELKEVRNFRPSFNTPLGIWGGLAYSGTDALFLRGRIPWTFRNSAQLDAKRTLRAE